MFVLEMVPLAGAFSSAPRGSIVPELCRDGNATGGVCAPTFCSTTLWAGYCVLALQCGPAEPCLAAGLREQACGTYGSALQGGLMSVVAMPWRAGAGRSEFGASLPSSVLPVGAV